MDEDAQYGDYSGGLNPLALVALLLGVLILIRSSRQNGLKALLGIAVMVPLGQQIDVLGLHLMFFRILIAVGLMRVFLRGEYRGFVILKVDKLFILWTLIPVTCGAVRGITLQQFGFSYDALGVYFLVRILTKEPEDVLGPLRFLCMLSLVVAAVMCFEAITHRNPFSVMGGVPMVDSIREGRARAQGPFQHPIFAGIFGASLFPLAIGLWLQGDNNRRRAIAGTIGSILIVITSVSSGAVMTTMAACVGLCLWRARNHMRWFRRGVVIVLIALALAMKPPIWYLIAKVSDLVGGSGWYRSWLIDVCVRHFGNWWLVGDSHTLNWAPTTNGTLGDPNNLDLTNYYVVQCAQGGIWMVLVFIAILVCCFQIVGRLVHADENLAWKRAFIWTFGVGVAAYCTTFISSAVVNQIGVFWHWLLAVVVGLPAYVAATDEAGLSALEPTADISRGSPMAV